MSKKTVKPQIILLLSCIALLLLVGMYILVRWSADTVAQKQGTEGETFIDQIIAHSEQERIRESVEMADDLSAYAANLINGGPSRDGVAPIEDPQFISVEEVGDFLEDASPVFVLEMNGEVKVYPQKILVWHEVVNDAVGGEPVAITYSPLSGSVVGFSRRINEQETTFGTSGYLLNSNLVLYDRATKTLWPQVLGMGIAGDGRGEVLGRVPVFWSTWKDVRDSYPEALILSENTGFTRSYGYDPYGSYLESGTYYDAGGPLFPVMHEDDRFSAKTVMIGMIFDGKPIAVQKEGLQDEQKKYTDINGERVLLFWDAQLETVRVLKDTSERTYEIRENTLIANDGTVWQFDGRQVEGEEAMEQVPFSDLMWFSWVAYYPGTEILE